MILLSPFGEFLIEHWELIGFGATTIVSAVLGLMHFRNWEKANINQTNAATIEALNELIAARDKELQAANESFAELEEERDEMADNLEAVRSEYKVVSSIRIAELIAVYQDHESHQSQISALESEIRILKRRLERLEIDASIEPNLS